MNNNLGTCILQLRLEIGDIRRLKQLRQGKRPEHVIVLKPDAFRLANAACHCRKGDLTAVAGKQGHAPLVAHREMIRDGFTQREGDGQVDDQGRIERLSQAADDADLTGG